MRSIEKRLVEAARSYYSDSRRADSSTWEFADAIAEKAREQGRGWREQAVDTLKSALGHAPSLSHLTNLRMSVDGKNGWAPDQRVEGACWRAHTELDPSFRDQMLAHVAEHGELTLNDAIRMRESHQPSRGVTQPATTQQKVEAVREALADPDVAVAVASDIPTRAAFSRAAQNVEEQEIERTQDRQRRESPGVYGFARTSKVDNLLAKSEKYEDEAMDLINELVDEGIIKDAERQRWVTQLDRQSARIEFMKSKLAGDTTDEELRAFMGGGAA